MSTKNAKEFLEDIVGPTTFGMMLRAYLAREDMTQVELAKMLGVSKAYISNIINERQVVSLEKAKEIVDALGDPPRAYMSAAVGDMFRALGFNYEVVLQVKTKKSA